MENTGELIRLSRPSGELVHSNQAVARAWGQLPSDLVGFAHPADAAAARRWWETLRAGTPASLTWRVRLCDGGWRWLDSHGTVVPYRGTPHVLTVCRDVTEQKHAEEAVRECERKLADLQRIAQIGYWEYQYETDHIEWSDEVYRIFGLPPVRSLTFADFWERIHPDDQASQARVLAEAREGGGRYEAEYRIIRADGEVRYLHTRGNIIRDHTGRSTSAFGTVQDITDLRRAEAALSLFRSLLDHTNDVIEVIDPETGRILDVNEQACRAHGYTRDEYLALTVSDIDPAVAARSWNEIRARRRGYPSRIFESQHRRKDGSLFPVEVNVSYVQLDREYVLAVVRDITERKRAEAKLRESADSLQHLSARLLEVQEEERRHIARELHDEFGQLLATVTLHLQAAKGVAGEAAHPHLQESMDLLQRAGDQVRSLALELRPTMLETAGLDATLRTLASQHQQRTGTSVEVEGYVDRVSGDLAITCFRVVQEALTNVVRHAAADHVWIELSRSEAGLRVEIRDDGVGFELGNTPGSALSRTGLGLLGMRERVERLGGTLSVESTPTRGTRVAATFPVNSTASGGSSDDRP
jgi:PAS domain S-box-containing protein